MKSAILIGLGVAAMLTSIFLAIRETKEDCKEERKEEKPTESDTPKEDDSGKGFIDKVAGIIYRYWPTMVFTLLAIFCFGMAYRSSLKQTAALLTAYKATSVSYQKYKEKTKEIVGERQEDKIARAAAKDISEKEYQKQIVNGNSSIVDTGEGETVFYDVISKRFFKSSFHKMLTVERDLQELSKTEFAIPLNTMYKMIGIPKTSDGKRIGWNAMYDEIKFKFYTGKLVDDTVCVVLGFICSPNYEYMSIDD